MNIALLIALVSFLLLSALGVDANAEETRNFLVNGGFEQGLTGWTHDGEVGIETAAPLTGGSSLRIGPGAGSVHQRYAVTGLRIVGVGATLKAVPAASGGAIRVQCYDAHSRLLMDLDQALDSKKADGEASNQYLYFKTHAYTAYIVVSIEKRGGALGFLYADAAELHDYDHDRKQHRPACNLDQYLQPFWKGTTIYNETVLLLSEGGKAATGRLLFQPDRLLSVQNSALKTPYVAGRHFTLDGKTLTCLPGSPMPTMKETEFEKGDYKWYDLTGRHVVVTYTHHDVWQGPTPHYEGDHLPQTVNRLTARAPLTVVAYGDSITLGVNVSGYRGDPPYMPTWAELFVDRLKRLYHHPDIRLYNTALGGMTSEWGRENAESAVASLDPDLVIVAFGMNDFWSVSADDFRANIRSILDTVRSRRPAAEFLLVASMRFDPAYASDPIYRNNLTSYVTALRSLTGEGVRLLDMTSLSEALFDAKKPRDLISDPLHPDDFLARWYAQGLVALLDRSQ